MAVALRSCAAAFQVVYVVREPGVAHGVKPVARGALRGGDLRPHGLSLREHQMLSGISGLIMLTELAQGVRFGMK